MEDNKTKEEILREAADNYVSNHADGEVRRMYGHHLRSFKAGWNAHESYSQQSTKHLQDRVKELESWKFQARNIMYDLWAELQNTGYSSSKAELIAKTNAFMNPDLLNTKS